MRWVAVLAVTYVLVLQSFLAGAVLAMLPLGPSHELCLSGAGETGTGSGKADGGHAGTIHCQACLARADLPTLPPPAPTVTIDRLAIELKFDAVVRIALRQFDSRRPFQPRAPPSVLAA
ncbi:DUF2946 family protein [Xanthobacter sp. V3C-3]|uniref:DUF2946 family protein n=1 Tax=Xanthobacter lutulentifluminis TaxID=3119935 RepID=UPI00372C8E41